MGVSRLSHKKQPYYLIAFRILLALLWTQHTVLNFARVIIMRIPYIGTTSELFIPICIVIALIVSIPWFLKTIRGKDILFYTGFVVLVLITMVVFKDNIPFLRENWSRILISAVPFYFVGISYSHSNCSRDLFWCSVGSVTTMLFYQFIKIRNGEATEDYNMNVAYILLPSVMYLLYYAIYKDRKKYWIIGILSALSLFIFGTRGPILCAFVFIIVYFLHRTLVSHKLKNYGLLLLSVTGFGFMSANESFFKNLAGVLSNIFARFGFSTRIFDFLAAGDATTSTGRDYLTSETIDAIIANPIFGYGFTGDQYLLGVYCHNIFLELWCHFGIIGGSIVLICLLALSVTALVKASRSPKIFYFALMLICMVYVKLMLSSSYTLEPFFYFMIGAFVAINRKCKKTKKLEFYEEDIEYDM